MLLNQSCDSNSRDNTTKIIGTRREKSLYTFRSIPWALAFKTKQEENRVVFLLLVAYSDKYYASAAGITET